MHYRSKYRIHALGTSVLGLLFIVSSLSLAPTATAAQGLDGNENTTAADAAGAKQCRQNVSALKGGPEAKTKHISPDAAVDFYCVGSMVGIVSKDDPSVTVTKADDVSVAKTKGSLTTLDYPDVNTQPGKGPIQSISDDYTSRVLATIYYGQDQPGTANDWIRAVNMMLNVGLKTSYHDFVFGWSTAVAPWDEQITFSGTIRLQRMEGWTTPVPVDQILWNNGPGSGTDGVYTGVLKQPTRNAIYSIALADFHVINYAKAFSITINQEIAVPRFLCNYPEQCKYPDGKEAPVF